MIDLIHNPDEIIFLDEQHRYVQGSRSYPSVTSLIRDYGLGEDFSFVSPSVMARAQDRGNKVHMACQFIDEDDLDETSIDPDIRGYVEAYLKFRRECVIKVIATEKKIISHNLRIGGTPDIVCFIGGRRAIVDRKTSQVLGKSLGPQTAGYKLLWEMECGSLIYDRYGLRLGMNGQYKLVKCDDPRDIAVFNSALEYHHMQGDTIMP